ncbi:MAG: hypothetical protein KAS96_12200 [Planctomycetes bacterium]|nr:hypothetical protein [Planctomycetota bacterium]
MGQGNDRLFINYIQQELRSGKSKIEIPNELLQGVSKEAMREGKALVKLSGAKIVSIDMS